VVLDIILSFKKTVDNVKFEKKKKKE